MICIHYKRVCVYIYIYIYVYILDSLVAQDAGEEALGVASVQCVGVGVAEGDGRVLDAHLVVLSSINVITIHIYIYI